MRLVEAHGDVLPPVPYRRIQGVGGRSRMFVSSLSATGASFKRLKPSGELLSSSGEENEAAYLRLQTLHHDASPERAPIAIWNGEEAHRASV